MVILFSSETYGNYNAAGEQVFETKFAKIGVGKNFFYYAFTLILKILFIYAS